MNKNRYLTIDESYEIDYEFRRKLSGYKIYLRMPMEFSIHKNKNIVLNTTALGVLTLFVNEKNKKGLTTFNYMFIR